MTPERKEKLRLFACAGVHEHESAFMLELLEALDQAEQERDKARLAEDIQRQAANALAARVVPAEQRLAVLGQGNRPIPKFTFDTENQGRDPSQLTFEAGRVLNVAPGLYRHYKGHVYRVIDVVRDSTNGQGEGRTMVLYYSDAAHGLHVRELEQFTGTVEVEGQTVERFRRVGLAG